MGFALNLLAFPTAAVHTWDSCDEFLALTFRRHWLCLLMQTNAGFGAKLVDALWTAQHGDMSRLRKYSPDPGQADKVLEICRRAQQVEVQARKTLELATLGHALEDSDSLRLEGNAS